jgi:hypothetical protein
VSFSETFGFSTIFYVGYAVYLGVTSVVAMIWILFTRRFRRAVTDSSTSVAGAILEIQYTLVYSLLKFGKSPVGAPPDRPSYRQIFTVAGTTGVALATVSGIVVVSLQYVESLA